MRHRPTRSPPRIRAWLACAAAGVLLAGCGRAGADWRDGRPGPQSAAPASGYIRPPQIGAGVRTADGGEVLSGQAEPGVRLRLASPDGGAYGATTDDSGGWSIALPASGQVRLFGLSEEIGGRVIQGEGYVAVLPAPGRPAVLLRAGGGAAPLEQSPALQIVAVDFDAAGGGVILGHGQAWRAAAGGGRRRRRRRHPCRCARTLRDGPGRGDPVRGA